MYNDKMKLGGFIVYVLSIAEPRMRSTTRRNLDMFHQLCGDKAFARVVLGTTTWGWVDKETGKDREKELATNLWLIRDRRCCASIKQKNLLGPSWTPYSANLAIASSGVGESLLYLVSEHTEVDENREIKNDIILRIQIALPRRLFLKNFISR